MRDRLSFGVVGLGFGANHARVLSTLTGLRLAAICDPDDSRRVAAADSTGAAAYADYQSMLCKEALDAVIVAVPARLHEEVACAAIAAGCAVLVEKPLAPTLAEGRRLAARAGEAGVILMPGHIERFNPAVVEVKRLIEAGEIGRVLEVSARRMGAIVVRAQDVNVVHDSAIHDIDVMRYLLGTEVARVYAEGRTDLDMPFEDGITAVLRFGPSTKQVRANDSSAVFADVTGVLDVNWLAPRVVRDLTVRGSKGVFILDYAAQTLDFFPATSPVRQAARGWQPIQPSEDSIRILVETREPLVQELSAFVAALRDGTPPPVSATDALAALSVCDALTESARTSQPVIPQRV